MKILGLNGAIGWDGNIPHMFQSDFMDLWVHGSGATLIVDGELKNSSCEERFSRTGQQFFNTYINTHTHTIRWINF